MVNDLPWYKDLALIQMLIDDFKGSPERQEMLEGEQYYRNENEILNRKLYYYDKTHAKVVDETKPNNTIAHAFLRLQVDEKTGYFLGRSPNITAEDKSFQDLLITTFDEDFDDTLHDVCADTSTKGISWLYVYPDEAAKNLRYEMFPGEIIVPLWKDRAHRELDGIIVDYYQEHFDTETGKKTETHKIEAWHPQGVMFYTDYTGVLVEDIERMFPDLADLTEIPEYPETGVPHFSVNKLGQNWGFVPFIPFRNNSMELSDLRFVRKEIDSYDKGVSDLANLMEEIKRLIVVLKNFQGSDLSEFMENLRYYGAVKTDEDGGVDKLDLNYSIDSTDKYLDRLKKDIARFGQSVDMDTDKFGANPSGVALEFLYSGLKLKVDSLERKFKRAFKKLFQMAATYYQLTGKGTFDWTTAKVTFNRSEISNVLDQIKAVAESKTLISEKTALAHHPWVDDVTTELEEMANDTKISLDKIPAGDASADPNAPEPTPVDPAAADSGGGK